MKIKSSAVTNISGARGGSLELRMQLSTLRGHLLFVKGINCRCSYTGLLSFSYVHLVHTHYDMFPKQRSEKRETSIYTKFMKMPNYSRRKTWDVTQCLLIANYLEHIIVRNVIRPQILPELKLGKGEGGSILKEDLNNNHRGHPLSSFIFVVQTELYWWIRNKYNFYIKLTCNV